MSLIGTIKDIGSKVKGFFGSGQKDELKILGTSNDGKIEIGYKAEQSGALFGHKNTYYIVVDGQENEIFIEDFEDAMLKLPKELDGAVEKAYEGVLKNTKASCESIHARYVQYNDIVKNGSDALIEMTLQSDRVFLDTVDNGENCDLINGKRAYLNGVYKRLFLAEKYFESHMQNAKEKMAVWRDLRASENGSQAE